MNHTKPVILITTCLFSFSTLSCKKETGASSENKENKAQETPLASPQIAESSEPSEEEKKILEEKAAAEKAKQEAAAKQKAEVDHSNAAVALLGRLSDRPEDSYSRYTNWVSDLKKGPTGKERYISHGLYSLSFDEFEKREFEKVRDQKAYPELSEKVVPLLEVYSNLAEVVNAADRYYEHQDYKDDGASKGRELHVKMMPLFDSYFEKKKDFLSALEKIQKDSLMAQLEEHKKNGFTLAYDIQFSLTVLEETLNYFKNKKPQELSTDEMKVHLKSIQEQHQKLEAHLSISDEVKNALETHVKRIDSYSLPYKKLIRLIDEKGTKSVQSAHIQNIYIGYNNMIGTYNSVIKNEVLMTQ